MAETVKGGRYLGADGRFHDSEGRLLVDEVKVKPIPPTTTQPKQTEQSDEPKPRRKRKTKAS